MNKTFLNKQRHALKRAKYYRELDPKTPEEALEKEIYYRELQPVTAEEFMDRDKFYEDRFPTSRSEAEKLLNLENVYLFDRALVWIANQEPDLSWALKAILPFTNHPSSMVRAMSASSLSELAQRQDVLDTEIIVPVLKKLLDDPDTEVRDSVGLYLEELSFFFRPRPYWLWNIRADVILLLGRLKKILLRVAAWRGPKL